eukprot:CAMPEP_0183373792 /NCGR_PEP_ID=MMETSP0164_2-20130417/112497_1 /TAXON_ID=221442 /ORGANISM="Coccolithus pelagicus ssp braarudi, Strain PLY182g" /LENGTH=62 /DNA_ID=CAMNT_0025550723 /DNA_START=155 /DNA_END=343 /DNA_ORIENTATION=-
MWSACRIEARLGSVKPRGPNFRLGGDIAVAIKEEEQPDMREVLEPFERVRRIEPTVRLKTQL